MDQLELEILVKDLQALPKECEWVEFKVNNSNLEAIGEYISALSNSACLNNQNEAYLVFGIEDQTHTVVGTGFHPRNAKKGNQELENWLATQLNPRIDFSIHEFEYQEAHIALFRINSTINTPVHFRNEAYVRVGSYKKNIKDHPEKARAIWSKSQSTNFEKGYAKNRLTSEKVLELIDFQNYYKISGNRLPETRDAVLDKLEQEKIIEKKRSTYSITNLGALLFARDLTAFDSISRKAMRVIIYDGNNRIKTLREQVGKKGYAVGFEGLINYITDQLPANEEIGKVFREEVTLYPPIAIRELVANSIIHQDLSRGGSSPMVEIFDNRIEITNPGKPLIDTLRFIDHSPESRNELFASTMRRMKICEERGSGIDKVISACEQFQLPAPDFVVGDNFTRVTLYSPRELTKMDKKEKARACYQHCVLRFVSGELMTNESLRDRFQIDAKNYPMASRIIKETMDQELIKDYDPESKSRKFAKYIPFWA